MSDIENPNTILRRSDGTEIGTATTPVRVDPTGTTTQPVNVINTPSVNQSEIDGVSVAVNTGTANAGTQRVVLATDQPVLPVSDNGGSLTVDGIVSITGTPNVNVTNTVAVSGPLTDIQLRASAVSISASSLPLPAGAATEATLSTKANDATITARLNTLGQKTSANSAPVVIASDQSNLGISGTVTANVGSTGGLALDATLTGGTQRTKITDGTTNAAVKAPSTPAVATDPALVVAISPNSSLTASNPSVSNTGAAVPAEATQIGASDGTNLQTPRVFDLDSGAGAQYVLGVGLRRAASGGSVEAGTATEPLRTDPTGTTTQPVSGTVSVSGTVTVNEAQIAGTSVTVASGPITLGTQRVVLATDQPVVPISDNGSSLTVDGSVSVSGTASVNVAQYNGSSVGAANAVHVQPGTGATFPVSGTITSNIGTTGGLALDVTLTGGTQQSKITDGTNVATVKPASTAAVATDKALVVAISPNNSLTVSNPSVGATGAAAPASATQLGVTDGTNLQTPKAYDTDSGAGSEYTLGVSLRKTSSGGSVEAGTVTDPIRTDPTGTTTQPVSISGTVPENLIQIGGTSVTVNAGTANAGTQRVILASDQSAVPVTDNGGSLTVDGSVSVTGTPNVNLAQYSGSAVGSSNAVHVQPGTGATFAVSATSLPLPTGAATEATLALIKAKTDNLDVALSTRAVTGLTDTELRASPVPVSGTVTANIGTTGGLALDATLTGGTQRTKITDGTNNAAVKAASTAAVAADPALVVAISPNNPISVSDPSVGLVGSATPANATTTGASDGTNLQVPRVFDADTGAGTQYILGVGLRKSASGGSVEAGTSSDPLRIDPTGTTAQPITDNGGSLTVDGAVAATQSGAWSVTVTGTSAVNVSQINGVTPTMGSGSSGTGTQRVILATDQSVIPVSDNGGSLTVDGSVSITGSVAVTGPLTDTELRASAVPISATSLPLPTGAATEATLATRLADSTFTGRINTFGQKTSANSTPVVIASDQSAVPVSGTVTSNIGATGGLALDSTLTGGTVRTKITDGTTNAAVKAASTAAVAADPALVVAISPNNTIAVSAPTSSTATSSNVSSSASSVTLLASNSSRKGATIYNDSTKILYLKLGSTASTTSFTIQLAKDGYYEVPFGYTGVIDGIWAAVNGAARVTEIT